MWIETLEVCMVVVEVVVVVVAAAAAAAFGSTECFAGGSYTRHDLPHARDVILLIRGLSRK